MRTKTYVFEDIKRGIELIKEIHGPEAVIVDVKTFGFNGHSGCEISVLIEDGTESTSLEALRKKKEDIWKTVFEALKEWSSNMEKHLFLKRVEQYPLPLRVLLEKMRKNCVDFSCALELISETYIEAEDLIDGITKAYYFLQNVIKRKIKLYELKKDFVPILLLGPYAEDKSVIAKKLSQFFKYCGVPCSLMHLVDFKEKFSPHLFYPKEEEWQNVQFFHSEEEILQRLRLESGKKAIVDSGQMESEGLFSAKDLTFEKILVLPATLRDEKIEKYCEKYRNLISGVAFTKLEEELTTGHILNHMFKLHVPLSLLCTKTDIFGPKDEKFFRILIEGFGWKEKEGK